VLWDFELKYNILEKKAYALVKFLKAFKVYIMPSNTVTYVPTTTTVKDIPVKGYSDGKRGKFLAKIQEYDMDIKPTKLIKGEGLAKILLESNCQALGINLLTEEDGEGMQNQMIKTIIIFLCEI